MELIPPAVPGTAEIRERHERILTRLRAAAERGGHDPAKLRVVAVTKTWPVDVARAACDAGLRLLGESRVQEAEPKVTALPEAEWHLVGRLQSNKVRRAVRLFSTIHSVDSVDLLRRIEAAAADQHREIRVLLQVNLAGSPTTAGFDEDEVTARELLDAAAAARGARVVGLMTIARNGAADTEARATFERLRHLRDLVAAALGRPVPELSMGMSNDAEPAAEAGATLVRIGTALFGTRG